LNTTQKITFGAIIGVAVGFALKSVPIGIGVGLVFGAIPFKKRKSRINLTGKKN